MCYPAQLVNKKICKYIVTKGCQLYFQFQFTSNTFTNESCTHLINYFYFAQKGTKMVFQFNISVTPLSSTINCCTLDMLRLGPS